MAPFAFESLTVSPPSTPAPAPQVEPPAPEPEAIESEADILRREWAGLRTLLDGLGHAIPDDKEELLEDKEIWMRQWSDLITRMQAAGVAARHLQIELELEGFEEALLLEGRVARKNFQGPIREVKEKAATQTEEVATARPLRSGKKTEVAIPPEKVAVTQVDMGAPKPGGRMTALHGPLAMACGECAAKNKACDGKPGVRCGGCNISRRKCSFLANVPRAAPKRRVPKVAPASSRAPTAESGPVASSSAQDVVDLNTDGEDEMGSEEVSITEGARVQRPPARAPSPLVSRPKKCRAEETLDRYEEGEELARLRAENTRLRNLLRRTAERARVQQAQIAVQSNRLYSMSREWKEDEELAEFL